MPTPARHPSELASRLEMDLAREYYFSMLDIALVTLILVAIWGGVAVALRRARSWGWRVAVVIAGLGLTLLAGAGIKELMSSRTFQLFGGMVNRVETSEKVIALTFDDGPSKTYTGEVLELLRDRDVRATFFVTGAESFESPITLRQIVDDGHEIGNHTWSHPRMIFRPGSEIASEIERTDTIIRAAGYDGPIHFRSPFGKRLVTLPLYLRQNGRTNIFWDLEPDSYPDVAATPEGIVDYVTAGARPGSIVLLHVMYPSRETSRAALPILIDELRKRGYRFVTVSELISLK